jgi:hypothetical protein
MRGKLATVIDRIEHGHHVFRAYFKNAFLKQYEKFVTFLRNELVSNNLADFQLRKGLDHLHAVLQRFQDITGRFAGFQAQWLNVHVDFPLLQRLALPITAGAVRYPGIRIHDPRVIRLLEVLLHDGSQLGGWTSKQIHHAVLTSFRLSKENYRLNQLRYDLRKLEGHGLLQRRIPIRLPAYPERRADRAALPLIPQTALWATGPQPLPPPPDRASSAGQQAGSRLSSCRYSHPTHRLFARRVTTGGNSPPR